jgi:hypothetical protein
MQSVQSITEFAPCLGLNTMQAIGVGAGYFVAH